MIHMDEILESILNLAPMITDLFFKEFEMSSDLFKDFNKTHTRTLMLLKFDGSSTMSSISKKVELEKGSFTPVANKLIELGYIEKVQSTEDKRKSLLQLTKLGHTYTERFHQEHSEYIYGKLNKLSKAEREAFIASINLTLSIGKKMLEEK